LTCSQCHQRTLPEDWHKSIPAPGRTTRGLQEFRRSQQRQQARNRTDLTPGLPMTSDRHLEDSGT
jgi:hypothetical protein